MSGTRNTGISNYIREQAARPEGFSTGVSSGGYSVHSLGNNAWKLIMDGRLIGIGQRKLRRLFVHREHADAYQATLPELQASRREYRAKSEAERKKKARESAEKPPKAPRPEVERKPKPAKSASDAPVKIRQRGPWKPGTETIIPEGVKVQKLPGTPPCDLRYCVPPGKKICGEFSAIPYGATLEDKQ